MTSSWRCRLGLRAGRRRATSSTPYALASSGLIHRFTRPASATSAVWARGARGGRIFLAFHAVAGLRRIPPPRTGPANRFRLQAGHIYPGVFPVAVGVYALSPPSGLRRIHAPIVSAEWGPGFSAMESSGPSAAAVRRTARLRLMNWSGSTRSVTLTGHLLEGRSGTIDGVGALPGRNRSARQDRWRSRSVAARSPGLRRE